MAKGNEAQRAAGAASGRKRRRSLLHLRPWWISFVLVALVEVAALEQRPPANTFHLGIYALSLLCALSFWWTFERSLAHVRYRFVVQVGAWAIALLTTLLCVASLIAYRHFAEFTTVDTLVFLAASPRHFWDYLKQFLFGWPLIPFVAVVYVLQRFWVWSWIGHRRRNRVGCGPTAVGGLLCLASAGALVGFSPGYYLGIDSSFITALGRAGTRLFITRQSLRAATRSVVEPLPQPCPYDVLLVINESWGRQFLQWYHPDQTQPAMPFLERWVAQQTDQTIVFDHGFTNSTATDVSLPSILTGVGPYESNRKLHWLPLPWDYARACAMYSVFVTSQRYDWANFDEFFFSKPPDTYATADQLDGPIINDTGVDDLLAAERLAQAIAKLPTDRRVFAILGTNALHPPFQQHSSVIEPRPSRATAYERGSLILDAALEHVWNSLSPRRKRNLIVVITADHADLENPQHLPRIFSFYDEMVAIPLVVRLPKQLVASRPTAWTALRANRKQNVSNLDIMPTLIDLLGFDTPSLKPYAGRSLLRPVAADRAIIALNTNEVRRWEKEGFGIFWSSKRFVYNNVEGSRLFDVGSDPDQMRDIWPRASAADRQKVTQTIAQQAQLQRMMDTTR